MLSISTSFAGTSGTVQYQTVLTDNVATPRFVATANLPMAHGFSWSLYAQSDRSWSEAYVGPAYSPTAWSQVGVQFGTESDTKVTRKAAFIWVGQKNVSVLALVEGGGSERFTAVDANYTVQRCTAGYVYDNFFGHGGKVSCKVATTYALWASMQERGSKITLQYGF